MICSKCHDDKEEAEFYMDPQRPGRRRARCKRCMYEARGPRRTPMTPEQRRAAAHDNLLRCRYRLSMAEYDALLASQGGVCADCGAAPGQTRLHVDHDHACCPTAAKSCGRCIRGLVCFACNVRRG